MVSVRLRDSYGVTGWGLVAYGVPIVVAFVSLLVFGIIKGERHFGRIACHTFSAQTHRPTKFVIYTTFDGGDCLTPTAGGKWIPTSNLREFGEAPK
jgi:hypothetical protein